MRTAALLCEVDVDCKAFLDLFQSAFHTQGDKADVDMEELALLLDEPFKSEKATVGALSDVVSSPPFLAALKTLLHGRQNKEADKAAAAVKVSRDLLLDRVKWRMSRDDSFWTLPVVIPFIICFSAFVMTHIQIYPRWRVQQSMEAWVMGYGMGYPGPYLGDHIGNLQQTWEWLAFSGLPSIYSACTEVKYIIKTSLKSNQRITHTLPTHRQND